MCFTHKLSLRVSRAIPSLLLRGKTHRHTVHTHECQEVAVFPCFPLSRSRCPGSGSAPDLSAKPRICGDSEVAGLWMTYNKPYSVSSGCERIHILPLLVFSWGFTPPSTWYVMSRNRQPRVLIHRLHKQRQGHPSSVPPCSTRGRMV